MITIIPAIDLKDGRCVRLRQGRADDVKIYSDDPVAMARRWAEEGAERLHVVDLDGAFQGRSAHCEVIGRIAEAVDIPVQAGGGLRTDKDIRSLLDCGVDRAIIGTRAFVEPDAMRGLVREFGSSLAVGIDARDGLVQVEGWVEGTEVSAIDLAVKVDVAGVKTLICTDTARDGMMSGCSVGDVGEICGRVNCDVIASGGISSVGDIKALRELGRPNLVGAIVGKALYEGSVRLSDLA